METSSPLSLFEAVFKVIEERLPWGRQIVTMLSALMAAVIFVFCVGYLFGAFAIVINWIVLSFKSASFAPFPHLSGGIIFPWWIVLLILVGSLTTTYQLIRNYRSVRSLLAFVDQEIRTLTEEKQRLEKTLEHRR
jgi:uncharacterized membrane protein